MGDDLPVYPKLASEDKDKSRIIEKQLSLRKDLDASIAIKKSDENLILGSWNIQNFGSYTKRMPESLFYIDDSDDFLRSKLEVLQQKHPVR